MSIYEIPEIVTTAWPLAATPSNIINAFKKVGISQGLYRERFRFILRDRPAIDLLTSLEHSIFNYYFSRRYP